MDGTCHDNGCPVSLTISNEGVTYKRNIGRAGSLLIVGFQSIIILSNFAANFYKFLCKDYVREGVVKSGASLESTI